MEEGVVSEVRRRRTIPRRRNKWTTSQKCVLCAVGLTTIIVISATVVSKGTSLRNVTKDKTSFLSSSKTTSSSSSSNNKKNATATICNTMPCLEVACRLKNDMDLTVDPCMDFFQYSCGGWVKRNSDVELKKSVMQTDMGKSLDTALKSILESDSSEAEPIEFNMTRAYYRKCMRKYEFQQGFAIVKSAMDEIGTIYDNDAEWKNTRADLTTTLYQLLIRRGAPLFNIANDADSRNFSLNIIKISLPRHRGIIDSRNLWKSSYDVEDDLSFFQLDVHFNSQTQPPALNRNPNVTSDGSLFYKVIQERSLNNTNKNMFTMLREYFGRSAHDLQQQKLEDELRTFILNLHNLIPSVKVLSRLKFNEEIYESITIEELTDLFTHVNWTILLEQLFNRPFSDDDVVQVMYTPYFKGLQALMSKTNSRIVHNAALALYARDVLWELAYYKDTNRWKFCVDATKVIFPIPLSAMYLRSHSSDYLTQLENETDDLFNNLKKSFQNIIVSNKWLDNMSKVKLQHKVSNMSGIFVSFDFLHSDLSSTDQSFENFTVTDDNFIEYTLSQYTKSKLEQYRMETDVENITEHLDYADIALTYTINAYHLRLLNLIGTTLGYLTPPNYIAGQPNYVTYGILGSTFAHEISHGFDISGIRYDEYGEKRQWLPNRTVDSYIERTRCFFDTYSKQKQAVTFMGQNAELYVDSNFTLDENLADNVGHKIAYQAYKEWIHRHEEEPVLPAFNLTTDQLFFISQAQRFCSAFSSDGYITAFETDPHTPQPLRVNALVMNSQEFAEVFQCPVGSPMNPVTKCQMW